MFRRCFSAAIVFLLMLPCSFLHAKELNPPPRGFSLTPSQDWVELPLPFQGRVVSYGKKGTLATFHITERDLEEVKAVSMSVDPKKGKGKIVDQLKWEDLFSPEFKSIDIRQEGMTVLAGEKAKFCIYTLKPGEFKKTMEGNLQGKYINYVLIHRGKLFSITFKDAEEGFVLTYPSFLAAIRTFRFDAPNPISRRRSA